MQIICGQCGERDEVQLDPETSSIHCPSCGHEIYLPNLAAGSDGYGHYSEVFFTNMGPGYADQARRALRERLLVVCAHCGVNMRMGRYRTGQVVCCAACGREMRIPSLHGEGQFDAPAVAISKDETSEPDLSDQNAGGDPPPRVLWLNYLAILAVVLMVVLLLSILSRGAGGR